MEEKGAREVGLGHSLATKLPLTWEGVRAWAGGCGYGTELSLGGGGSCYYAVINTLLARIDEAAGIYARCMPEYIYIFINHPTHSSSYSIIM